MCETAAVERQKVYNLTPRQKAEQMNVSVSFLAKDRMKETPDVPFKRWGTRVVRYSAED